MIDPIAAAPDLARAERHVWADGECAACGRERHGPGATLPCGAAPRGPIARRLAALLAALAAVFAPLPT